MNKTILCILFFLVIIGACAQINQQDTAQPEENAVYCTADVQECPDGSFVARDPEKGCAFKECP